MGSGAFAAAARTIGGRYELESLLGKGGIGEVWRAKHIALNSQVAIKFLQGGSAVAESAKRRFAAEAQITAQLKTPNAVQVFDFGVTDEGQPYLVMELLEGETLGRRIERFGYLGMAETSRLLGPCARALHRAHQLGIVHRDFKPDNVIICSPDHEGNELVKVLDFGIAKLAGALEDRPEPAAAAPTRGPADPSFTKTGTVLGTPLYMAPEQARDAAEVDLRADIWAFGIVAFECLTGVPPFTAPTIEELFVQINAGLHARASDVMPTLPPAFDQWFDVACAPDRERRFPNASAAWKELAQILPTEEPNMRTSSPGASGDHKRVLVVSGERNSTSPDASAATMDAPKKSPSVPPRAMRAGLATLQRVTLKATDEARSQQALVTTSPTVRKGAGRLRAMLAVAGGAVLFLVVGGWRFAEHKGSNVVMSAAGTPAVPSAPPSPDRPAPTPAAMVSTLPATPESPSSSAIPSPSTTSTPPVGAVISSAHHSGAGSKPTHASQEPATPPPTPSAAAPPPPPAAPPPPPPPATTAAAPPPDPGSYR